MKKLFAYIVLLIPFLCQAQMELNTLSPSAIVKGQTSMLLIKMQGSRFDVDPVSLSFGKDIDILRIDVLNADMIGVEIDVKSTAQAGLRDLHVQHQQQTQVFADALEILEAFSRLSVSIQLMPFEFLRLSDFDPMNIANNPLLFTIHVTNDMNQRNLKLRFLLSHIDYGELLLGEKNLSSLFPAENRQITNKDFDDYLINEEADKFLRKSAETSFLPAGDYELTAVILDESDSILAHDEQFLFLENNYPDIDLLSPGISMDESPEIIQTFHPFFQWFSSGYTFDFRLVEVQPNQFSAEEIMTNIPVYQEEGITQPFLNYPLWAEMLEAGKTYAWQVSSYFLGSTNKQEIRSEVYWFSIDRSQKQLLQYEQLSITPDRLFMRPGEHIQLQAYGNEKKGEKTKLHVHWEIFPKGMAYISSEGEFVAGNNEGIVQVRAYYKGLQAEATILISNRLPAQKPEITALVDELFGLKNNDIYVSTQTNEHTELKGTFQTSTQFFESMELDFSAEGPVLWEIFKDKILMNPLEEFKTIGLLIPDKDSLPEPGKSTEAKLHVDYSLTYADTTSNPGRVLDSFDCIGCRRNHNLQQNYVYNRIGRLSKPIKVHSLFAKIRSLELQGQNLVCDADVYPAGGSILWEMDGILKKGEEALFLLEDSIAVKSINLQYEINGITYSDTIYVTINKFRKPENQLEWVRTQTPDPKSEKETEYNADNPFTIGEISEFKNINILSPQKADTCYNGEILIAFQINPRIELDPRTVRIFISAAEVSSEVKIIGHTVSALFTTKVRPDLYDIEIRFRDKNQQMYYKTWSFFVVNRKSNSVANNKEEQKPGFRGNLQASTKFTSLTGTDINVRQEPPQLHHLFLDGKISYKKFEIPLKLKITNQENALIPHRNRFMTGIESKAFTLHIGDFNPCFHKQVLNGLNIRGIHFSFVYRGMTASYVHGEITRALEGQYQSFTGQMGFPPGNLQSDSSYLNEGIYKRNVSAINLKFNSIDNTTFNVVFLKSTDDIQSISYGGYAGQNFVFGASNQVRSRNGIFDADFGVALSVVTEDIRRGVFTKNQIDEMFGSDIPFYPEKYQWLITLNSTTKPFNWTNRPPLAVYGKARLKVLKQRFYFHVDRIGAAYYSYGNPYLLNDRLKFGVEDRFSLFKKKLRVNLGYTNYQNNLSDIQLLRKLTHLGKANFHFRYKQEWPMFQLSYRFYYRSEKDLETGANLYHSYINSVRLGGMYNRKIRSMRADVNLFYTHFVRCFLVSNGEKMQNKALNFSIGLQFPQNIRLSTYYNTFVQIADTSDLYLQGTLGFSIGWHSNDEKIQLNATVNRLNTEENTFQAAMKRNLYRLAFSYRLLHNLRITAETGYGSFYPDTALPPTYTEFWGMLKLHYYIR
jgi:hypothetical protein